MSRAAKVRKGAAAKSAIISDGAWIPPVIDSFYVSGTSIGGSDPTHMTPWATFEAAYAACMGYVNTLNAWWAALYPGTGDVYADESCIIVDNIHLDGSGGGIRCGIVPNPSDHPPAPPMGAVQLPWTDGTDWISMDF